MDYKKGDIVLVAFYPGKGQEIGKLRPAIVMSDDIQNRELDVLIVIPLSTKLIDNAYPYRVRINKRERLNEDSDALIYHIRAISKKRIKQKIATLKNNELKTIKYALCEIV